MTGNAPIVWDKSPSSRRAWIEIKNRRMKEMRPDVALLAEGVDRNTVSTYPCRSIPVALLAEGVDRNYDDCRTYDLYIGRPPRGGRG